MAKITEVRLVDDLNGNKAEETVEFGLDGKHYEIDLGKTNAKKLRAALEEFDAVARRGGKVVVAAPKRRGGSGRPISVDREQNQAIREWAIARGMTVNDRGRIPSQILTAYHGEAG